MSITYWQGEIAVARRCIVIVDAGTDPYSWFHRYAGQERAAVEIEVPFDPTRDAAIDVEPDKLKAAGEAIRTGRERRGLKRIYIDDQGFRLTGEALAKLRERTQATIDAAVSEQAKAKAEAILADLSPDVGSPGWGWRKVTEGKGAAAIPHAELKVEAIARYLEPVRGAA